MKKFSLALFIILSSCINRHAEQDVSAPPKAIAEDENVKSENPDIMALIVGFTNRCGDIKLPFTYDYNTGASAMVGCIDSLSEQPYRLLRQKLGCDVIYGVLPETEGYTAVLVGLAASMMNVELITLDSAGGLIDRESIMHNHCIHYVEEDLYCREQVTLSDSFGIWYTYESKYVLYDMEENADTVCDVYQQSGRILRNGDITLEELIERSCE